MCSVRAHRGEINENRRTLSSCAEKEICATRMEGGEAF